MNWIPKWIPEALAKVLPYVAVLALIALSVYKYNNDISKARQGGFDDGVAYQQGVEKTNTLREREENENEKQRIERQAQSNLDALTADRDFAVATADRMQRELQRIRLAAQQYTGAQPFSVSTGEVIGMLTDMLESSNVAYRLTATEAESYRSAGLTCQNQYNSLRGKDAQATNSSPLN